MPVRVLSFNEFHITGIPFPPLPPLRFRCWTCNATFFEDVDVLAVNPVPRTAGAGCSAQITCAEFARPNPGNDRGRLAANLESVLRGRDCAGLAHCNSPRSCSLSISFLACSASFAAAINRSRATSIRRTGLRVRFFGRVFIMCENYKNGPLGV
jgi:hypothetical protein